MASATAGTSATGPNRLFLYTVVAQCLLAAVVVAAQVHFLYPADEQSSPAGVYEMANQLFVAVFALAAGLGGAGAFTARIPLLVAGGVFAAIAAFEWATWSVDTAAEDWGALGLWVAASVALVFLSRRRPLPALAATLLAVAAVAKGVAIGTDITDEGSLGLGADELSLSWTYLLTTAMSAAAIQLGFLHLAARPGGAAGPPLGFSRERGFGARVAGAIADARYRAWLRANPGKTFGDYYGARLSARLADGGSHKTLGAVAHQVRLRTDVSRAWAAREFAQRGSTHRDWFFARGVTPDMSCVDYGCGSLRVGQHFIRRLGAGRWFGLDVVDRFWKDGLTLVEPETIATKRPAFALIGPEGLAEAAARRPDLVYSTAVLQHVPPAELKPYFRNLAMVAHEGVACANFKRMATTTRIGPNAWAHAAGEIADAARAAAPGFTVAIEDDGAKEGEDFAKATLVMSRDPAALKRWVRSPLPVSGAG